jgi:antitoxin FitA
MAQVLIRGLKESTVKALKKRARANGRSLQAELKQILEEEARLDAQWDAWAEEADRLQDECPPQTSDSADLIREDRDR